MAELNLNIPEMPSSPKIIEGDDLIINVADNKQLEFKNIIAKNNSNSQSIFDPAGYIFSKYDKDFIEYLSGQVLLQAFDSIKSNTLQLQSPDGSKWQPTIDNNGVVTWKKVIDGE